MPQASVPSTSSALRYRVVNPATGAVVEEFPTATDAQVKDALAAVRSGLQPLAPGPHRRACRRRRPYCRSCSRNARRNWPPSSPRRWASGSRESVGEAEFCADIFNYYAQEGPGLAADQPIKAIGGGAAVIQKRPDRPAAGHHALELPVLPGGPVCGAQPDAGQHHHPQARRELPPLGAGDRAAHARRRPARGAYINLFASHAQIETIICRSPRPGRFPDGFRAGRGRRGPNRRAQPEKGGAGAWRLRPLHCPGQRRREGLGRRPPLHTRMENAGQACNSNKRIIVMDAIHDEFVQELADQAAALTPGRPCRRRRTARTCRCHPRLPWRACWSRSTTPSARAQPCMPAACGQIGRRYYLAPTVLSGVTPEMRAFSEELFGPVVVVYKVSSDAEAVALANNSDYGLGGAVFSPDGERALAVAQQINSGMVAVNAACRRGCRHALWRREALRALGASWARWAWRNSSTSSCCTWPAHSRSRQRSLPSPSQQWRVFLEAIAARFLSVWRRK